MEEMVHKYGYDAVLDIIETIGGPRTCKDMHLLEVLKPRVEQAVDGLSAAALHAFAHNYVKHDKDQEEEDTWSLTTEEWVEFKNGTLEDLNDQIYGTDTPPFFRTKKDSGSPKDSDSPKGNTSVP